MGLSYSPGPNITVASGATNSDPVICDHSYSDADVVGFLSPAVLAETANLQISPDFDTDYRAAAHAQGITVAAALTAAIAAATWVDADSTEAALGTAGQYKLILTRYLVARALRVHLNGAAAADRVFKMVRRTLSPEMA
jgi:hypothetical protein